MGFEPTTPTLARLCSALSFSLSAAGPGFEAPAGLLSRRHARWIAPCTYSPQEQ